MSINLIFKAKKKMYKAYVKRVWKVKRSSPPENTFNRHLSWYLVSELSATVRKSCILHVWTAFAGNSGLLLLITARRLKAKSRRGKKKKEKYLEIYCKCNRKQLEGQLKQLKKVSWALPSWIWLKAELKRVLSEGNWKEHHGTGAGLE